MNINTIVKCNATIAEHFSLSPIALNALCRGYRKQPRHVKTTNAAVKELTDAGLIGLGNGKTYLNSSGVDLAEKAISMGWLNTGRY